MGAADRPRLDPWQVARRGWYWGADYGYVTRAFGEGLVRQAVPRRFSQGTGRDVVLLPGVLENWTMLRQIAEALSGAGHRVHTLPDLHRNTVTVPVAARVVEVLLRSADLADVVLVAHSKGGLVGKQVMLGPEGARIRSMVAVATPFSGSTLARLVPWSVVRTLGPDDATIRALGSQAGVNERITSIFPAFDPHIPGGSRLAGAAANVQVAAMGHFRVLADREAIDAVVAAAAL